MSNTYIIKDNLDRLKVLNRYAVVDEGITCDHVGCGIAFSADVKGAVKVDLSMKIGKVNDEAYLEQYFTLFIDGERQDRLMLVGKQESETHHTLTLCENISGGHLFELHRCNEAMQCCMTMKSIKIDGELLARPADKKLLIEFIGDSITAGYGNLADAVDVPFPSAGRTSDGTQTYAFLTAKALDADYTAICASGMAFSYGLCEKPVSWYYANTGCYRSDEVKYDFSRPADAVVINLGTNDWDNCRKRGYEYEDLREFAKPVIMLVRRYRPDVKIVWAYGMMNAGYTDAIKQGLNDLGGEENGLYFCPLSTEGCAPGGGWHSSVAGHTKAAGILSEFLKTKVLI